LGDEDEGKGERRRGRGIGKGGGARWRGAFGRREKVKVKEWRKGRKGGGGM